MFSIGNRINNRYSIQAVKSYGSCLTCFCHDEMLDRSVVIKTPRYDLGYSSNSFARWAKKWILAGREMGIAEAYTLFTVADKDVGKVPCLVIEFIRGDDRAGASLEGWIQDSRLDLKLMLYFSHTICSVMNRLQKKLGKPERDFVHLNLKPQNVLITHEGSLKITDIGLSALAYGAPGGRKPGDVLSTGPERSKKNHGLPVLTGTAAYFSPEQCLASQTIDRRSDIYSFGCMMYEMCTRRQMFDGSSECELVSKHIKEVPVSPRTWDRGIPRTLERLILGCVSKNPAERPSNFLEIRETIREIIKSQGMPSGIGFWLFGFSGLTATPRIKSDMDVTREAEAILLSKICGSQYVIDQGLVKDAGELEAIRAEKEKIDRANKGAERRQFREVDELLRIGDTFLQMAMDSEGDEAKTSARIARHRYGLGNRLIPNNPQIRFRIGMASGMLAQLVWEENRTLGEKLWESALAEYDAVLDAQEEAAIAMIGETYFLLPFHAMFQQAVIRAIRGEWEEAVLQMKRLTRWIKQIDRTQFKLFFERLEQAISDFLTQLGSDDM